MPRDIPSSFYLAAPWPDRAHPEGRGYLRRLALRGPGRTSSGGCGPLNRLRFFASLESGYPGVVLPYCRTTTTMSRFTILQFWSEGSRHSTSRVTQLDRKERSGFVRQSVAQFRIGICARSRRILLFIRQGREQDTGHRQCLDRSPFPLPPIAATPSHPTDLSAAPGGGTERFRVFEHERSPATRRGAACRGQRQGFMDDENRIACHFNVLPAVTIIALHDH